MPIIFSCNRKQNDELFKELAEKVEQTEQAIAKESKARPAQAKNEEAQVKADELQQLQSAGNAIAMQAQASAQYSSAFQNQIETAEALKQEAKKKQEASHASENRIKAIEKELGKILHHKAQNVPEIKEAAPRQQDFKRMVLVRLSLQDQISELEKIIKGLDSNAFTPQQLAIVKEELIALYSFANKEREKKADNQDLINMRNSRLKIAMSLLI